MGRKEKFSRHVCKGCGRLFVPKSRKQKYHDEDCRKAFYGRTYFAKTFIDKTCLNCGSVFPSSSPKKQLYCNPECREAARKKRMDARSASVVAERHTFLSERISAFERDGYRCFVCGRGPKDGAVLDVMEDGAILVTVCAECKAGKETK